MVCCSIFIIGFATCLVKSMEWHYIPPRSSPIWGYFTPPVLHQPPLKSEKTAMDEMVDLTNALGVAILQDHSYSRSNFAFSPYGMASVLVVLYEGACGESARQIQRTVGFPSNKDVIRIGFRDIHSHLRNYFSHEGFLSGITLNKETTSLHPNYRVILKFYGYDVEIPMEDKKAKDGSTVAPATTESNVLFTTRDSDNIVTTQPTIQSSTSILPNEDTTTSIIESAVDNTTTVKAMTDLPKTEKIHSTFEDATTLTTISCNFDQVQPGIDNKIHVKEDTDKMESTKGITEMNLETVSEELELITKTQTSTDSESTVVLGESLDNGMLVPQPVISKGSTVQYQFTTSNSIFSTLTMFPGEQYESERPTEDKLALSQPKSTTDMESGKERTHTTDITTDSITANVNVNNNMSLFSLENREKVPLLTTNYDTVITTESTTELLHTTQTTEKSSLSELVTTVLTETTPTHFEYDIKTDILKTTQANVSKTSNILNTHLSTTSEMFSTALYSEQSTTNPQNSTTTPEFENIAETDRYETTTINSLSNVISEIKRKRRWTTNDALNYFKISSRTSVISSKNYSDSTLLNDLMKPRPIRTKKRAIKDYLKHSVKSDLSLQLQNGMYDTFISRNANTYRNLPRQLFLVDGVIDTPVPVMTYTNVFPFAYNPRLHCKALEFPLDDVRYKLLILLPIERRGVRQLLHDLENCSVREIINTLNPTRVRATIPTFMVEGFVILTSTLQRLGVWDVFDPRRSNLSGMSTDPELYVRNVEQSVTVVIRNYVEVLDIQTRTMAARHLIQDFEATHPFVYFVLDTATNVALMAGQMLDPLNSRIY